MKVYLRWANNVGKEQNMWERESWKIRHIVAQKTRVNSSVTSKYTYTLKKNREGGEKVNEQVRYGVNLIIIIINQPARVRCIKNHWENLSLTEKLLQGPIWSLTIFKFMSRKPMVMFGSIAGPTYQVLPMYTSVIGIQNSLQKKTSNLSEVMIRPGCGSYCVGNNCVSFGTCLFNSVVW